MTSPICPLFSECGGCTLQDVGHMAQVKAKAKRLNEITGMECARIVAEPLGYRNRMDFCFNGTGLGLKLTGTWHSFVDILHCPISNEGVNRLLTEVRAHFPAGDNFDPTTKAGTYRYAVIRSTSCSNSVSIVLNPDSPGYPGAYRATEEFSKVTSADSVLVTRVPVPTDVSVALDYDVLKGSDHLKETLAGCTLFFHAQGFFQNNSKIADMIHEKVRQLVSKRDDNGLLVDLFGGVGSFGMINRDLFDKVLLIESDPLGIAAAKLNIEANSASNVSAIMSPASAIHTLSIPTGQTMICDPPRSGMAPKTIRRIVRCKPQRIIYISCNMEQLARELHNFRGYKIASVTLADMFPQTRHAEAIIEFVPA